MARAWSSISSKVMASPFRGQGVSCNACYNAPRWHHWQSKGHLYDDTRCNPTIDQRSYYRYIYEERSMVQVTIDVPEALAARLAAVHDRLPEILEYGLDALSPLPNDLY